MDDNDRLEGAPITLAIEGPNFFRIGFWLTVTYIGAVVGFSLWDWIDVARMKPNEWGDFLAGVFGPLALLWVVLGFLQQGSELKNSRDALLLQAKELKNSVEQQKALVAVSREQVTSEIEALKESRQQANLKIRPRLRIEYSNAMVFGQTVRRYFSIINDGEICVSLRLFVYIENRPFKATNIGELVKEAREQFSIDKPRDDPDYGMITVHASFVDGLGTVLAQEFLINNVNDDWSIGRPYGQAIEPDRIPKLGPTVDLPTNPR
ncbi:hypothetical protein [Sphingorhabdus sp. EL138]|uniref:hypothetical protein n=1 Tax=Sphingorhabdus sp. EL138 TaxID=2073156 RepID=UPI000D69D5BF|nr:hypothetical protein [Sphingorhabdus sp. EL138]